MAVIQRMWRGNPAVTAQIPSLLHHVSQFLLLLKYVSVEERKEYLRLLEE